MKITVNLDTQAVITQPSPLRFKGGCFNPVEIGFTRGSQSVPLPDGTVIEFSIKPKNQWTGGLLAYLNAFTPASGNLYSGSLNCATAALLAALGLSDQVPANDVAQVDVNAEVTWSYGDQKFRSVTFTAMIEAPITDSNAAASPDPELYPVPSEVARKNDIPVVGTAAKLEAGTPNGAATLDGTGKLTGTQVPASVALKSDIVPTGSNRIVIANRFSLGSLPATDANGKQITEVHVGDVVHQTGIQGTPRTALGTFSEHTITEDDVNNGWGVRFCDENWACAPIYFSSFGESGAVIYPSDFAYAFANWINSYGLNVSACVTGDGQVTITSYTSGPLPGSWSFQQDTAVASYSETEGTPSLPPGDFIVADLNNLGNAMGYQGIGDTVDFLSGYGAPTLDIGEEGNGYVDQNNGDFYHRSASGWNFVLNIKGPQGMTGPQGLQGPQGSPGVAAGGISPVYTRKLLESGSTYDLPYGGNWTAVVWSPELGLFCAFLNQSQNAATSPDGVAWTSRTLPFTASWIDMAWSPELGLFCGIAQGSGNAITSPDGITWTSRPLPYNSNWCGIVWSPELHVFCVVGGTSIATSTDGINWTAVAGGNVSGTSNLSSIVWAPEVGLLVSVGGDRGIKSSDGTNWQGIFPSTSSNYWYSVAWSPQLGLFCAVADNNNFATSTDGTHWTRGTLPSTSGWYRDVKWSPELGVFYAVSRPEGVTAYSFDGLTWRSVSLAAIEWWKLAWSSELGVFCAIGSGKAHLSSFPKKWITNGGFYTPVATLVANVQTVTPQKCRWSRQGRVVYVEGCIQIDSTTTAMLTKMRLSLPTPSTFTAASDLSGTLSGVPSNHAGSIAADTATGTALFSYTPTDVTNQTVAFALSYAVMPF